MIRKLKDGGISTATFIAFAFGVGLSLSIIILDNPRMRHKTERTIERVIDAIDGVIDTVMGKGKEHPEEKRKVLWDTVIRQVGE